MAVWVSIQLWMKRVIDIIAGSVGCFATGIMMVFLAPAIWLSSPGSVFFVQERIGLDGKPFYMYKFRTMYPDADLHKQELMNQNIMSGPMFKVIDDPRIIGWKGKDGRCHGIGYFLRRTSLDEFPQFLNVLKGEMSLVGPRPPSRDEWDQYDSRQCMRLRVKPGITGPWQAGGRSRVTDFGKVLNLDMEYINNWNIFLDLKIIIKTVRMLLTDRDGAF